MSSARKSATNGRLPGRSRATYALWDLQSGNLVGAYDTTDDALRVVRRSIEQFGRESVVVLALARESAGRIRNVAQGEALADLAAGTPAVRASRALAGT
jgi:hypothetical protein